MTSGPWYNTYICNKLHGNVFEGFIRNAITDRYNIMCAIDAHEKLIQKNIMVEAEVVVIPNRSISFAWCNHRFHWLLAKILRTKFARTLSYVFFYRETFVSENIS